MNHAFITAISSGVGLIAGILLPWITWEQGADLGAVIAATYYTVREMYQWSGKVDKPDHWWWDATMDILFPWLVAAVVVGAPVTATLILTTIAIFHWFLRPPAE